MGRPGIALTGYGFINTPDLPPIDPLLRTDSDTMYIDYDRFRQAFNEAKANQDYDPFAGVKPHSKWITVLEQKACIVLSHLFLDIEIADENGGYGRDPE